MISFPFCKINLGLNVVSKRPDGFHEIETCFYPVPWTDILEVVPSETFMFEQSGNVISGNHDDNLCVKAYQLLKNEFEFPPVKIHLHKVIPTGAGLGGGSSDAAHMLRALNDLFDLALNSTRLKSFASQLGSDCSFFIEEKAMVGKGRGEILEVVHVDVKGKFIVLVKPNIHVSTAEAYSLIKPSPGSNSIKEIVERSEFSTWRTGLKNDFEISIFTRYPSIREIKEKLYKQGAIYASMSGSGSTVFGIFDKPVDLKNQFPDMTYWSGVL